MRKGKSRGNRDYTPYQYIQVIYVYNAYMYVHMCVCTYVYKAFWLVVQICYTSYSRLKQEEYCYSEVNFDYTVELKGRQLSEILSQSFIRAGTVAQQQGVG